MSNDWLLWQLADSAFPIGGFAHSGGLEAAVQLGVVRDAQTFEQFLDAAVVQINAGISQFARSAWECPDQFEAIDRRCDLFLNSHVSNRASRAQGGALLMTAMKAFAYKDIDGTISRCAALAKKHEHVGHFASVFGVVSKAIAVPRQPAHELFLFIHVRGYISAAVRLGIVGPMQGQQIQSGMRMPSSDVPQREPAATHPMLDLYQLTQDRLYSRLFQS